MIRLSNTLKRLMKVGAILFGLAFIIAGVIGIRQDDTFLPTKAVIRSMERTYEATDANETDTWEVMVAYSVDLYNPNNPEGIVLPGKTIWFIFMIAGAAVAVIAAVLLVRDLRNR